MANMHRGDVDLTIGSEVFCLRLTLQSLAEIEAAFGVSDLVALGERLSSGRLSASDLIHILGPAVRGGGGKNTDAEIAQLVPASALASVIAAVADLLERTFGDATANP